MGKSSLALLFIRLSVAETTIDLHACDASVARISLRDHGHLFEIWIV